MRDPSEDELDRWMARLARGDRAAFDPLFRALEPRARRLASARVPREHVGDAAQTILMKVFARASDFEPGRAVLPWFYALAAGEVRTFQRRGSAERRRLAGEEEALAVPAADDPERDALDRELRRSLDLAVQGLDEESAAAIRAMLGDGSRPAVSAATFRKRVSRAYARLRILLGEIHGS